jgi:hypothetical protein
MCMIYCLQSWRLISETMSILNVLECCGFGWLTEEHPGSPSVHLSWRMYHHETRTGVPSGPTAPSSTVWLKDVTPCCLGTQIISFVSVCNHSWGISVWEVCIMRQSCQLCDTLPGNWDPHGFSCILHFTFDRLLATAIAREEHQDRLWRSLSFVFSQHMG